MKSSNRLLLGACLLNLYDAVITIYATQHLGLSEGNPVMCSLLASNVVHFLLVKVMVFYLVSRTLERRYAVRPRTTLLMTAGIFTTFLVVGVWNTAMVALVVNTMA